MSMLAIASWAALAFAPPHARPSFSATQRPELAAVRTPVLVTPAPASRFSCTQSSIRMDGDTPDDLMEYSLRMVGFGASAVAGLIFTIFVGPVQAFMRNPKTASIAGVGLGIAGLLLIITLRAMTDGDVGVMPREAVDQADNFNSFVAPRLD
mmetsp:Transcript_19113/g.51405  ORF Transcript_19113/g.51405 Transcript_19113/m.51405 type:complete len:152 (-) Transcript_19113:377-832(-)